jgi:hypothetical protein
MRFIRFFFLLALLLGLPVMAQRGGGTTIRLGDTLQGLLSTGEREVKYTFEGEQGEYVTITMIQVDSMDPYLRLEDARGTVLAQDDDSAGSLNSRIGPFRLPANGTYTIVATSLGGRDTGEFTLSLQAPVVQRTEYGQRITGELTPLESQAEYTFYAEAGTVISIDLISNDFDAYLTLASANPRSTLITDDDSGIDRNARIGPYVLPDDGDYQIVVSAFGSAEGEYALTLNRVDAAPVEVGASVRTQISGDQAAYFSFEGQAGDVVDVRVDTGGQLDTALSVITPTSRQIASADDVDDSLDPFVSNVILTETGTYFVSVQPNVSRDERTPITLKVTQSIIPSLDNGAQSVRLGDYSGTYLFSFTGAANERVTIRVVFDTNQSLSPNVRVKQETNDLASISTYTIAGEISFGVVIPQDGRVLIELQDYNFDVIDATVSVERE